MIDAVDAKIESDRIIEIRQETQRLQDIARHAIAYYQRDLLFDKQFVAAEQAIFSHITHTSYKTIIPSVNAAEWSKAIDTVIDELQQLKRWKGVNISTHCLS